MAWPQPAPPHQCVQAVIAAILTSQLAFRTPRRGLRTSLGNPRHGHGRIQYNLNEGTANPKTCPSGQTTRCYRLVMPLPRLAVFRSTRLHALAWLTCSLSLNLNNL